MKTLLSFCTSLLFCLSASPSFAQDADVAAIHALLDRLETVFATGDVEGAMTAFTDDAIVFAEAGADIAGTDAIRAAYTGMMTQFNVELVFDSKEVEIAGDLAYERGMYTLKLTDKATGQVATAATYRHIHILKRQSDGSWKTWRMMVNAPQAPATQ